MSAPASEVSDLLLAVSRDSASPARQTEPVETIQHGRRAGAGLRGSSGKGTSRYSQWMERAQAGDREAYRALLEDCALRVRSYLRRRLRDEDDTNDVLQEVLMAVHRARHTSDPERPFEPWLWAIARNSLADHVRKRRARARWEVPTGELPEVIAPAEPLGEERLHQALERLPRGQRQAFCMRNLEGLSVETAALRACVSPGALRVRVHRAGKALAAMLGE